MTRLGRIAVVAVMLAGGCAHTKTTDTGQEEEQTGQDGGATPSSKAEKPRPSRQATRSTSGGEHPVPLATGASGLLAPGAEDKIRARLIAEGCLPDDAKQSEGSMSEGLRRCQKAHDLPGTGMPDHATVKALGLNPDEIFRQGPVKD